MLVLLLVTGCAALRPGPRGVQSVTNPFPVQTSNEDVLWERTIDVLHSFHFEIERENRLARVIETRPRVGSGILEPWHHDSVGLASRLESTAQSIRRTVIVTLIPTDRADTFHVSVQALKDREDYLGTSGHSIGAATFLESEPLQRDLSRVVGPSSRSQWIPIGRDLALEQAILQSLFVAYSP